MTVDHNESDEYNAPDAPNRPSIQTSAECTVKVKNQELIHSVISVKLKQYINDHHALTIFLKSDIFDRDDIADPSKYTEFLGESISVGIKPITDEVDASSALEFIGVVTEVRFENSVDDVNILVIKAKSPTIAMDGAKKNSINFDQKASDIVSGILGNYPITKGTFDSTSKTMECSVQYRETDYAYVQRLASSAGKFAFYDGKEFRFISASSADEHELLWRELLGSFSLGLGTVSCNYEGSSYNYADDSTLDADTAGSSPKTSLSSMSQASFDASQKIFEDNGYWDDLEMSQDAKALKDVLENEKARTLGKMIHAHGHSIVPNVSVGHCIKIGNMGSFNQQFWVTEVIHIMGSGKYHNEFKCTPLDVAYPTNPATSAKIFAKIQRAIVIDNYDPDALGRIKVKFPWSDSDTIWVRYVSPHAGAEMGFYCLPEIDDEVLVAFEEGDPDRPIVIGSLYNNTHKPPEGAVNEENLVKMFKTKSGNQIVFTDEEGAEKIEISHGEGKNALVLDLSGPSVTITCEGGDITLEGNNITLKADSGITLEAGGDVSAEAGANMNLKATASQKIEASGTVDIKGATINLN